MISLLWGALRPRDHGMLVPSSTSATISFKPLLLQMGKLRCQVKKLMGVDQGWNPSVPDYQTHEPYGHIRFNSTSVGHICWCRGGYDRGSEAALGGQKRPNPAGNLPRGAQTQTWPCKTSVVDTPSSSPAGRSPSHHCVPRGSLHCSPQKRKEEGEEGRPLPL